MTEFLTQSDYVQYLRDQLNLLRAENERLALADKQWADHVRRLSEEVERLRAALNHV